MDEILECQLCYHFFDLGERVPKMIECGGDHFYCLKCIQTYQDPMDGFKCTQCGGYSRKQPENLKDNEFILIFLQEKENSVADACRFHNKEYKLFCFVCTDYLCEECIQEETCGHSNQMTLEQAEDYCNQRIEQFQQTVKQKARQLEAKLSQMKQDMQKITNHYNQAVDQSQQLINMIFTAMKKKKEAQQAQLYIQKAFERKNQVSQLLEKSNQQIKQITIMEQKPISNLEELASFVEEAESIVKMPIQQENIQIEPPDFFQDENFKRKFAKRVQKKLKKLQEHKLLKDLMSFILQRLLFRFKKLMTIKEDSSEIYIFDPANKEINIYKTTHTKKWL